MDKREFRVEIGAIQLLCKLSEVLQKMQIVADLSFLGHTLKKKKEKKVSRQKHPPAIV